MSPKVIIVFVAGVVLSAAGFYYAFQNVPLKELAGYMESVGYAWILPAAAVGFFTFVVRAVRWQVILSPSVSLPFSSVYHPIMIGFFINSVLPGRMGEIARPAIVRKKENVPFSLGIATVGTERMLDAVTLIIMFAWMMGTVDIDPAHRVQVFGYQLSKGVLSGIASTMIGVSAALLLVIAALNVPAVQRFLKSGILKIPVLFVPAGRRFRQSVHDKFCMPLTGIVDNIISGLSLVRYPKKLFLCAFYSAVIWFLQVAVFCMVAQDSPLIELSFAQMTMVFVIICFFIILPSVPGFWGIWEAAGIFGLALFGVEAKDALGFSLTVHVVLLFPLLAAGLVSVVVTSVNILQVSYNKEKQP